MLQKELAKRLRDRYDTKMDDNEWMEVSSDGIPLCRIKYNGQLHKQTPTKTSRMNTASKIADIQDEMLDGSGIYRALRTRTADESCRCLPITDSLPHSEIPCWRQPTVKRTALCSAHGSRMQTATRCSGEITRRTMNMSRKPLPCAPVSSANTACSVRMNRQTFVAVWTFANSQLRNADLRAGTAAG